MITDRIEISSDGDRMETALAQADKVARYKELDDQSAARKRAVVNADGVFSHDRVPFFVCKWFDCTIGF